MMTSAVMTASDIMSSSGSTKAQVWLTKDTEVGDEETDKINCDSLTSKSPPLCDPFPNHKDPDHSVPVFHQHSSEIMLGARQLLEQNIWKWLSTWSPREMRLTPAILNSLKASWIYKANNLSNLLISENTRLGGNCRSTSGTFNMLVKLSGKHDAAATLALEHLLKLLACDVNQARAVSGEQSRCAAALLTCLMVLRWDNQIEIWVRFSDINNGCASLCTSLLVFSNALPKKA